MPFVNIRIYEGHSQERKRAIVKKVTEAISEVAEIPPDKIWVVIEDVKPGNWAVGGKLGDEE